MGCPKQEEFKYREVLVSTGRPQMIRFDIRNRKVIKAFTYDRTMEFTWTADGVFINGPKGTEVLVDFHIR